MKDIEKKIADCFRSCKKILIEEYGVMGLAISRLVYVHTHIVCIYSTCMFTHSVMSNSLPLRGPQPTRLLCPWDFPDKHTGVGCHFLFQGIFPSQESNPSLSHCRQIVYHLSYQGSPWVLEWIVYPFSGGSSWPRNQTGVSCIAGGLFPSQAT